MSVTLQNLRDVFYNILREEEVDVGAYPTSLTDIFLNSAQQKICSGRVINPLNQQEARKGVLPFLNTDKFYTNAKSTYLTADTTVWATELAVSSTSGFENITTLYLWWEIISYTGYTDTTFTGVTGVTYARLASKNISPVFILPDDYASVINVIYNDRFKLEAQSYDDIFENLNSNKGTYLWRNGADEILNSAYRNNPFYSIKDDQYLIIYNLDATTYPIKLRYEKEPTSMTLTTDVSTISNDIYAKTTIPYLAVWEMLFNRGEEWRAWQIINFALWQIKEMYTHYTNAGYEKISGTHYKMAKGRRNI